MAAASGTRSRHKVLFYGLMLRYVRRCFLRFIAEERYSPGRPWLHRQLSNEVQFRQVGHEDYKAVVNMRSGIYGGLDYLASSYHEMLNTHEGYCAMVNGKMVGFLFGFRCDDNKTINMMSGRMDHKYEKQRIYPKLIYHILSQFEGVERISAILYDKRVTDNYIKTGSTYLFERHLRNCWVVARTIKSQLWDDIELDVAIEHLKKDDLEAIFKDGRLSKCLFPDDILAIHNTAYRLMKSNTNLILKNIHALISYEKSNFLSLSRCFGLDIGYCVYIELYGASGNLYEIRNHILHHVRKHLCDLGDRFLLVIGYNPQLDINILDNALVGFNACIDACLSSKVYGVFESAAHYSKRIY